MILVILLVLILLFFAGGLGLGDGQYRQPGLGIGGLLIVVLLVLLVTGRLQLLLAWIIQAQPEPSPPDNWLGWAQYGVLGLLVVAMIFGQLVPGYVLRRAQEREDAKNAELAALRAKMEDQVIPALVRMTTVAEKVLDKGIGGSP